MIFSEKNYFWKTVVFTLAFYLSGLFVWFTPLPLIFQLQRKRTSAFVQTSLAAFFILVLLYVFIFPYLYQYTIDHPAFSLVLSIPGMGGDLADKWPAIFYGLGYFLFFVVSALVVSFSLNSLKYFEVVLVAAAFGFFILMAGGFFLYSHYIGVSAFSEITSYYSSLINELIKIGEQNQNLGAEMLFMKAHAGEMASYLSLFTPAFMVITFLTVLLLNVAVAQKVILPFVAPLSTVRLSLWQVPFAGIWLTIVLLAGLLGNSYIHSNLWLGVFGNLLAILCFIYFVQGLALMMFFFEKKQFSLFMRFSIYMVLFLFFQVAGLLITVLGFADSWVDFRKRGLPQKKL